MTAQVFVVTTTYDNDGDHGESPEVSVFDNYDAAKEFMELVKKDDRENGITDTLGDADTDWDVYDDEHEFHAWNVTANKWFKVCLTVVDVKSTATQRNTATLADMQRNIHEFSVERMAFSHEHFAVEIQDMGKMAPPNLIYRSDLYSSRQDALAAFRNAETREAITALCQMQEQETKPYDFEGDYPEVEDYSCAYFDGVAEVVNAVTEIIHWVTDANERNVDTWFTHAWYKCGVPNFVAHN